MGKYYCILVRIWLKCGLFQKLLEGLWWWQQCIFRKTLQFLPSFKLANSVSSTYTTTKISHNEYRLLYASNIACYKENPHNLTKYKSEETLKTPISQLLSELRDTWIYYAIIQNSKCSMSSMNWRKLRSPARATFKNPNLRSLCELGKIWKDSLRPIFQNPNFASIDELGKFIKASYISNFFR